MKNILCLLILSFTLFSTNVSAQGKPADTAKAGRKHKPKTMAPAPATTPAPMSKKTPAPATTSPSASTAPATKTTPPSKPAVNPPNKSADKAVGTDAKGRTIYEGPRGGHYVLSPSGKKEYLKKSN